METGASWICGGFSGGWTFLSATGRVGGREAMGWRRGVEGWKTRAVSLRAKRSNLGSRGNGDCFASLAMTQRGYRPPALLRKTEMRPSETPTQRRSGVLRPSAITLIRLCGGKCKTNHLSGNSHIRLAGFRPFMRKRMNYKALFGILQDWIWVCLHAGWSKSAKTFDIAPGVL